MAAYATSADLIKRYDSRDIAMLASDTGSPSAGIATDPNVTEALLDASGEIDSALMVSKMYAATDLTSLTGNSAAKLKRLTCDLAMSFLFARRPLFGFEKYEAARKMSDGHLDRLRKGENIFDLQAIKDAGVPKVDGPTTVDYTDLNLVRDRTKNHYPRRVLPDNR